MELYDIFEGKHKPVYHGEEVKKYDALRIHALGEFPGHLIDERRPSEPAPVWEYRKKNYRAVTKKGMGKVFNTLSKIRRSPDWSIDYTRSEVAPKTGETLQDYCEKNYPQFKSLDNWAFSVLLQNYAIDANGVVVVLPLNFNKGEADYYRPYTYVFNTPRIKHFTKELLVIEAEVKYRKEAWVGRVFWVVTKDEYTVYNEIEPGKFEPEFSIKHNFGFVPARKFGGRQIKSNGIDTLYESRLADMVPDLDTAALENNELGAEITLHVYSERWEYQAQPCQKCYNSQLSRSTGFVITKGDRGDITSTCSDCGGTGYSGKTGPFSKIVVTPPTAQKVGDVVPNVPMPPAGYIEKSTTIAELLDKRVDQNMFRALSAINYEFLMQSPLAQSGVAKQWDSEAANEFTYQVAEDIVSILDWCYFVIAYQRYIGLPNMSVETIKEMVPAVAVPQRFDLASSTWVIETISAARNAKVNPLLIAELEKQLASTVLYNDPDARAKNELINKLDPLLAYSVEDKMSLAADRVITNIDYITSAYIVNFVSRAMMEYKGFETLDYPKQRAILEGYAKEVEVANSAQTTVLGEAEIVDKNVSGGGNASPSELGDL